MANSPVDPKEVGSLLTDLGLLIGILQGTPEKPEFNPDWFSDPKKGFENGFEWPNLKPIITQILGDNPNPLAEASGVLEESWFPIKINDEKGNPKDSGFYFVEKTVGKEALLGAGMAFQFTVGSATITPYLFVPVFKMPDEAGSRPIFGLDLNGPVEMGVLVTLTGTFGDDAYNGALFVASFDFSKTKPDIIFKLRKPSQDWYTPSSIEPKSIFDTLLGLAPIKDFLDKKILPDSQLVQITWGQLAYIAGFLTSKDAPYEVADISIPTDLKKYVEGVIFKVINAILDQNAVIPLVEHPAPTGGGIGWSLSLVLNEKHYGLNIRVNDVTVVQNPRVRIQIGAWTEDETDWIKAAGGEKPIDLGLNFYVLSGLAPDIKFDPQFEAISVGFDVDRKDEKPLFDIKGVSLAEIQPRGYFSTLNSNAWGVALAVDKITLPFGPSSATGGSGSNPVAETLMSSSGGEKEPVNPEFSFIAAWQKQFYLQLFDRDGKPEDIVVVPLQKSFGPVELKDIGVGWKQEDYHLLFQLDGGLNLNTLQIMLDKLTVGVPVKDPANIHDYTLDLEGMEISLNTPGVSLTGGFLKMEDQGITEYNGLVSVLVGPYGIGALGSFAVVDGHPSMFIFGALDAPLGGPPYFFLTGLAMGFGYNRALKLPAQDQVQNFPLVKAVVDPSTFTSDQPNDVLQAISEFIPPELGEYWLAAGVKFTSFELIDAFGLLTVSFGKTLEVALLGLATLQLPKQSEDPGLHPYVSAQLAIEVIFAPADGVFKASAVLTDNSYVLDKNCRLTGGFAFYLWFAKEHAGDFVVTLGGYNDHFAKPAWYPDEPRLGFIWNVSSDVTISGGAYFALTPSAVMAGGKLSLVFQSGNLKAWFKAWADFLIAWKPFHYDISIGINIGASYRLNLGFIHKTFTISLGADVELWGPKLRGVAHVHWFIISFTIHFGEGSNNKGTATTIQWPKFQDYFLPKNEDQHSTEQASPMMRPMLLGAEGSAQPAPGSNEVVKINVSKGLIQKFSQSGTEYWVVDPGQLELNTDASVPATQITLAAGSGGTNTTISGKSFGVRPVGSMTLSGEDANHQVSLKKQSDGGTFEPFSIADWNHNTSPRNVPDALWGTVNDGKQEANAKNVPGITTGLSSLIPTNHPLTGPVAFNIKANLSYQNIETRNLPLTQGTIQEVSFDSTGSVGIIEETLNNTGNLRPDVFTALHDVGSVVEEAGDLSHLAADADNLFRGSPMLKPTQSGQVGSRNPRLAALRARLGKTGKTRISRGSVSDVLEAGATQKMERVAASVEKPHRLKAVIREYDIHGKQSTGIVNSVGFRDGEAGRSLQVGIHQLTGSGEEELNQHLRLQLGQTQIWDLEPTKNGTSLTYGGKMVLRVLAFDQHRQLLADKYLGSGSPGTWKIPIETTQLVVRGLDPHQLWSPWLGWVDHSPLTLVNPQTLLGRGVTVRTKSPQRLGRNQFTTDHGLLSGHCTLARNQVEETHGVSGDGWTETSFPGKMKSFVVLGRRENSWEGPETIKEGFRVRLIYTQNGKKKAMELENGAGGMLTPDFFLSFRIPDSLSDLEKLTVWVQPAKGWTLRGVAGTDQDGKTYDQAARNLLLASEASAKTEHAGIHSAIQLNYTLKK